MAEREKMSTQQAKYIVTGVMGKDGGKLNKPQFNLEVKKINERVSRTI